MSVSWKRTIPLLVALLAGVGLFALGNSLRKGSAGIEDEMSVVLPIPVEITIFGGDRYLAANVNVWRAIMVGVNKLRPQTSLALATIQQNASWLNPAHEDNYYTATAVLPWEGHVEATQVILGRALDARPKDFYPGFFYAFNQVEFHGDFEGAATSALIAAEHATDPGDKQTLTVLAAKWAERSGDVSMSQRMVESMAKATRDPALRDYLLKRVTRLEGLAQLRKAAVSFEKEWGKKMTSLDELIKAGLIAKIPEDPLGEGYEVRNHWPVLRAPASN